MNSDLYSIRKVSRGVGREVSVSLTQQFKIAAGRVACLLVLLLAQQVQALSVVQHETSSFGLQSGISTVVNDVGESVNLVFTATRDTWDEWIDDDGATYGTSNYFSGPGFSSNAVFTWTIVSGSGEFTSAPSYSLNSGRADCTFRLDSTAADLLLTVNDQGVQMTATAHVSVSASAPFHFVRTEGKVTVTAGCELGTTNVPVGADRPFWIYAEVTSWDVTANALGETRIENVQSFPFPSTSGGNASFVNLSGDGTVVVPVGYQISSGYAASVFRMGTQRDVVEASIYYQSPSASNSFSAVGSVTIEFTPPAGEEWTFDHVEHSISAQLSGAVSGVHCAVTETVTDTSWEVWTSSLGHTQNRNVGTSAAVGAAPSFSIVSGSGSLSNASSSTDSNGQAFATLDFGDASGVTVRADTSYMGVQAWATLDVTPDVSGLWSFESSQGAISVSLSNNSPDPSNNQLAAAVTYTTWEIWRNSATGAAEDRNYSSGPAIGAGVEWALGVSGYSCSSIDYSTGSAGIAYAQAYANPGAAGGTVNVTVNFAGYSASASLTLPSCPDGT